MQNPVSQRITEIIFYYAEGNEKRFAESLGVKPAVVNNYTKGKQQSKPGFDVLQKICEIYPDISLEWLIAGKGQMLKGRQATERTMLTMPDSGVLIPVLNHKVAANYLCGYHSQEQISQLASMVLPNNIVRGKQFYAMQVSGDSMEPTLHDGDYVICHIHERSDWEYINNGEVCVMVTANNGLQVKRLQNKLLSKGVFTCVSDNKYHLPFDLAPDEINTIWKVSWRLSPDLLDEGDHNDKLAQLEARLERLERSRI